MKIIRYCFILFAILISNEIIAQHLRPGFDKEEFIEMLKIGAKADTSYHIDLPAPQSYKMVYQSPQMGLKPPVYFKSNDYVRTGNTIVLYADSTYYKKFPQDENNVWENHSQVQYLYLTEKFPDNNAETAANIALSGTWELNYISGRRIAFEGLYPDKKPTITINVDSSRINGSTSCNVFSGNLKASGNQINFNAPMAMTMMACPGEGETAFLQTLKKITSYALSDDNNTLTFIMGDVAVMRFVRK